MTKELVYEYPLRPGYAAQLVLPTDLIVREAVKLGEFILTLAVGPVRVAPVSQIREEHILILTRRCAELEEELALVKEERNRFLYVKNMAFPTSKGVE